MSESVYILGGGRTDFKRNLKKEGKTIRHIIIEAGKKAIDDAKIDPGEIQAGAVGNFNAGQFTKQLQLGAFIPEVDPKLRGIPTMHTEAACASGALSVLLGAEWIMGGLHDVVLVVGAEQQKTMSALDGSDVLGAAADYHNEKPEYGDFMFPKLFGRIAQIYIEKYGATEADLALVAWKNYAHAKLNPLAQMRDADLTLDSASQVSEKNPHVAPPLKVSDCSQITDGAASVVLVSEKYLDKIGRDKNKTVRLFGYGHTTDYLPLDKKDAPTFSISAQSRGESFQNGEPHAARPPWSGCPRLFFHHRNCRVRNSRARRAGQRHRARKKRRDHAVAGASGKIQSANPNSGERRRRPDRRRSSCRGDRSSSGVRSLSTTDRTSWRASDRERETISHVQHGR